MTTPVEKRNASKFCEFYGEVGHTTDECMHLKRKIEKMLKAEKLSHLIKELKQNDGKDSKEDENLRERQNTGNINGAAMAKDSKAKNYLNFLLEINNLFPTLGKEDGMEGLMIIEAKMGGHCVRRIYVDGGSSLEILQKKKGQAPERNKAIGEEVKKLVEADIMKEVHYHSWLLNPVMVKKHDDNWRMCVDFKDLNKACPKDGYPLPEIDWNVESLYGYPYKCFLDAYKGYHQIKMAEEDEKNTAFITSQGIFSGKSLPFFKTLKKCTKKSDFQWTIEAEVAFKGMKQLIAELPMLMAPKEKEELIMYLTAVKEAISAVLMTERDGKKIPIYFVSCALQGPEINYTPMEKLILALVSASKRFELGEHDMQYRPRMSVKGQILADFIVKRPEDDTPDTLIEDREELPNPWILFTNGSSCIDGSGAGLTITNPEGMKFTYALRFRFNATNNEAEYEALIAGLRIAGQMGVQNLQANVDSKLVAKQVNGIYIAKESSMIKYLEKVKNLASTFKGFSIKQIPRGENKKANALKGILLEEKKKARVVCHKAGRYAVINEVLNKKSFLGLWLRCVGPLQANYVLREIHEGSCNMHARPRSVVAKALRSCYYWPTMHTDARNLIRECNECQVYRPVPKNPQEKLTPITSPWLFYKWGIDIARPFLKGPGKVKFLVVAMDYFTKWIEARPVATITRAQVKKKGKQKPRRRNQTRLGDKNKNWVEDISHVLWAHRTMIKSSNGETPFSLTYGAKAVIPAEIGMATLRTAEVDIVKNNKALGISLDLLEEKREQVVVQEASSKAKMEIYYNARVQNTSFRPGYFVYWNNEASHGEDGRKLGPKWEGPYEVTEALGKEAYRLKDCNGHTLP
uniref:Reverse transcriptase domain-containing protein n=1 Tax=Tanacetum cinerariifolium TaxID=118510 RepID=A0A6L2M8S4_TANCI|nr:reverse transcriptase domain-containing protein [Tanacetum cinerariifolium]